MDAIKFIKERNRMCHFYNDIGYCYQCPAKDCKCSNLEDMTEDNNIIAIVEEWSTTHPHKTRQSIFLEQYPNGVVDSDGVIKICPKIIDKNYTCDLECSSNWLSCRYEFWMQEIE